MLKKFFVFAFFIFCVHTAFALDPIDYREFATNSSNVLLTNTTLYEVNIRILNGTTPIYEEYFNNVTTDDFGIFRVSVGSGNVNYGSYSFTPTNNHWIVCRIKPTNTDPYRLISQVKILSVVYKNAVGVGNTVESSEITDGTIVDADINANAAIQVSKLAGGSVGDFLVTGSGGTPTWSSFPPSGSIHTSAPISGDGTLGNPITLDYNSTLTVTGGQLGLPTTGVTANTYGDGSHVPQITVDAYGRITGATDVPISFPAETDPVYTADIPNIVFDGDAAGGDLTGTYPNPTIANGAVTSVKIADGTIVDADISGSAAIAVTKLAAGGANQFLVNNGTSNVWAVLNLSGNFTGNGVGTALDLSNTGVTAGSYGNNTGTAYPYITVDAKGRITGISTVSIVFPAETDPEVNMSTTNAVPKWNGTQLVDGSISDDGTTVSVGSNFSVTVANGNTTTNGNLTVNGNTTLGSAPSNALTVNATSTFNSRITVNNNGNASALNVTHNNATGSVAEFSETNASNSSPAVQISHAGSGDGLYIDASTGSGSGLVVNGNNTIPTAVFNTQTATGVNGFEIINTGSVSYAFYVNGDYASAAAFDANTASPAVTITNLGTGDGLYIDATTGSGSGLVVDGNSTLPTAIFNTQTATGLNGFQIINTGSASYAFYVNGDQASAAAFDANTASPAVAIANQGSGDGLYIDATTGSGSGLVVDGNNNASAAIFNTYSSSSFNGVQINNSLGTAGYSLYVTASNGARAAAFDANTSGPSVFISNTGTGLALSIDDNGGAVKLSYASDNTADPTVPDGVSVFYASANSTTITLPTTATNGQFLYIIYTGSTNATIGSYTTNGSASLTFVYANNTWYLVSVVE
jgi:hypothetical protein